MGLTFYKEHKIWIAEELCEDEKIRTLKAKITKLDDLNRRIAKLTTQTQKADDLRKKIRNLEELPTGETVYLIASGFPRHFGWRWSPLLPPDYSFEGEHITMWRGIPVPPDDEGDIEQ